MKRITLEHCAFDKKALLKKQAREEDTARVIDEEGVYEIDGKPVIIYGKLKERHDKMLWAVKSIHMARNTIGRMNPGETKLFGFRPQTPFGKSCCECAASAKQFPDQHRIICEFGKLLNAIYSECAPEAALNHSEQLKSIRPEWLIPGTRFTSGIINKDNPLPYHYDRGNVLNSMSAMVVFRQNCEGGFLSLPGLNARFLIEDSSYFLFDGQAFMHGVTPLRTWNAKSYRYSVVYYALRAMSKCGSLEAELNKARVQKRLREKRRCAP